MKTNSIVKIFRSATTEMHGSKAGYATITFTCVLKGEFQSLNSSTRER